MSIIEIRLKLPKPLSSHDLKNVRTAAMGGAVLHLYRSGTISGRTAAESLGLTYYDFLEYAGHKGVPVAQSFNVAASHKVEKKLRRARPRKL